MVSGRIGSPAVFSIHANRGRVTPQTITNPYTSGSDSLYPDEVVKLDATVNDEI